jgi:hypothetical protein
MINSGKEKATKNDEELVTIISSIIIDFLNKKASSPTDVD